MRFQKFIIQFGEFIGRSEGEKAEGSPRRIRWKKRFAFIAAGVMVLSFISLFIFQAEDWSAAKLEVAVPWSEWHTLFQSDSNWDLKSRTPPTEMVLASATTKADPHHRDQVKNSGANIFWIATEIPAASLKAAAKAGATVLSLGYFSSDFRLWMDDSLILTGTKKVSQSVFLPVSQERLLSGHPLRITFEIKNSVGWNYPDMLELFFKSPGFLTAESASLHEKQMAFLTATRPSVFFTLNLFMAIGFLFFWVSAPKRQEYFTMFLYCFVLSALQAHLTNLGQAFFSPIGGYRFDLLAFCLEASLALAIALAFARVKRFYVRAVPTLFIFIPLVLMFIYRDSASLLKVSSMIQLYLAPPLMVVGALVCFAQAMYLRLNLKITEETKRRRILRLTCFGSGMLLIAIVHVLQSGAEATESFRFWCGAHFGMVIFLAILKASDYHEIEALIGRVPFSEFHRPENLKVPVMGAVVTLDLKRSEVLMIEGARLGDSSVLVKETIALLRHTLSTFGGTMILTDGDAIKCFFPEGERFAIDKAVLALTHAQDEIKAFSRTLRTQQRIAEDYEISFRAGIAVGKLMPVLCRLEGKDYPEWEQHGQSQAFLESARLMEVEADLQLTDDSCILIFKSLPFGKDGWMEKAVTVTFKHGKIIEAVALFPIPVRAAA